MASPALAQDAEETTEQEASTSGQPAIVVTGSRIARDPNIGSPAPIVSVSSEQLTQSGSSDVVETLRDVPALSTSTTSDGSIDGVFSFSVGQSTLNLRGLGAGRTLVLVNGRRHVSGVAGAQVVDINSIPSALIESVETITGGASAVYGADAVTGVVNFNLRDDFEGIEANVQGGVSHKGDGYRFNGDLTWGTNFSDGRGNVTFTAEYARNEEILFGDRSFTRNNGIYDDQGNPALRFQAGDIDGNTPNFAQYYSTANGFFPTGFVIPDAASFIADYTATFGTAPTLTAAEQALIDRAANAPSRIIAADPRFSLSSAGGVIAPGDFGLFALPGVDLDNNGTDDCFQSSVGFNSLLFGNAFGIAGGCYNINADGSVTPYQDGQITGLFNQFGGDGIQNNFDENSLIPETERYSFNLNAKYEFSEAAELFFEGKYVFSSAEFQGQPNTFYDLLTVPSDNPFIPASLQALADSTPLLFDDQGRNGLYITRDPADLGPNRDRNEFETWRFVGGIRGEMTDHLRYELSANWGKFEQTTFDNNRVILDRFYAAIDAVTDPATGNIVCRSDLDPTPPPTTIFGIPAGDPGYFTFNPGDGQCRPANIFGGVGSISAEAIDFITATVVNRFELEQFVINGLLIGDSGAWFELPGGPIDYVVGIEFRKELSDSNFDPLVRGVVPVTTPDANAGDLLRDLPNAQNSLVFDPASVIDNAGGDFDVFEIFGEIRLPLLEDKPFANLVELNAAARYADYSTIGGAFTWNVNGLYSPVEDILFRATYAEAVRAPNINELFNPPQGAFFRPVDPCDATELGNAPDPGLRQANCTAFFNAIGFDPTFGGGNYTYIDPLTARFSGSVSGNPDLSEETATTWTVGAQFTPTFIPGFALSVDYYNIEIEDAISTVSAQDIVNNCVDSASIDNQFCSLVDRNPNNGGFTFLRQVALNFARLETAGVEAAAQYRFDLGEHRFTLAASGTWVDKLDRFFDPSDLTNVDPELGELQRPEWAGRASITWDWSDLSLTWSTNYLDQMALRSVEIEDVGTIWDASNAIADEVWIHDVSFSYDATEEFTIYGGVNNVFNRKPFVTEQAYPVSPLGTYFFLGATAKF
ncbi:TonB-dependent receptor domain-containing protein [Erythrobacter sp. HKB08]|uniref:TonB-dependent receptor domain-containing protein n=1 Tax=Erythrobacter sp. HKB08 TaxID=2502843 RepID=UPI0013E8C52D|nr:TonB-dependent receptor [Erythrobacter sp. HKB08]